MCILRGHGSLLLLAVQRPNYIPASSKIIFHHVCISTHFLLQVRPWASCCFWPTWKTHRFLPVTHIFDVESANPAKSDVTSNYSFRSWCLSCSSRWRIVEVQSVPSLKDGRVKRVVPFVFATVPPRFICEGRSECQIGDGRSRQRDVDFESASKQWQGSAFLGNPTTNGDAFIPAPLGTTHTMFLCSRPCTTHSLLEGLSRDILLKHSRRKNRRKNF